MIVERIYCNCPDCQRVVSVNCKPSRVEDTLDEAGWFLSDLGYFCSAECAEIVAVMNWNRVKAGK